MRRFKFTLESVLTVREKALENARIQLASITNIYNKQLDVLKEMQIALENISQEAQNYMFDGNFNPSLIANYTAFSNKIVFDIKTQEQIIEKTKIDLIKQQKITQEAYVKVKSLEKLKEKQLEQYNKELQQEEFKLIDDIVNSKRSIA